MRYAGIFSVLGKEGSGVTAPLFWNLEINCKSITYSGHGDHEIHDDTYFL